MSNQVGGKALWSCIAALALGAVSITTSVFAQEAAAPAAEPDATPAMEDAGPSMWTTSGFMRVESAIRMTGDENIVNQRGNPFNGKTVARDSRPYAGAGGVADTVTRSGQNADNEFNLLQARGQFDLTGALSENFRLFARARGVFDFAPYDEFDPDKVPGADPIGFNYQEPEYFEYRKFRDGSATNPLEVAGRKYMIDLPALYLDYQKGSLLVRVGQQQIAWGQALFFRVLDLPNGLDLRRHLFLDYAPEEYADERIGSLGIRTTWQATQQWEVDGFFQRFLPTIYPNANTPYNAIASQFTIHDQWNVKYDDKFNGGLRIRGNLGALSAQFVATRRYNPDGVYRWTRSNINRDLPGAPGSGVVLQDTAFEVDPTGVVSAQEWFTFAGNARLNGLTGLNASITEFPAAALLGANPVPDMVTAGGELDTFFQASGGLRGHLAREYKRETNLGAGMGYVISAAPGSVLDQLIINVEATFTPDRNFTNVTLSRNYIKEDEWIAALVMEKYQRFSQSFPATYLVFQYMYRSESDLFGRHLSGMGGNRDKIPKGVDGWNGVVFAMQQPSPTLTWRFDGAVLLDTRGGILVQPALRYQPSTTWSVETFYNFINGNVYGDDNENIMQTLEYADEIGIRAGFQF